MVCIPLVRLPSASCSVNVDCAENSLARLYKSKVLLLYLPVLLSFIKRSVICLNLLSINFCSCTPVFPALVPSSHISALAKALKFSCLKNSSSAIRNLLGNLYIVDKPLINLFDPSRLILSKSITCDPLSNMFVSY